MQNVEGDERCKIWVMDSIKCTQRLTSFQKLTPFVFMVILKIEILRVNLYEEKSRFISLSNITFVIPNGLLIVFS